ncbi:MAG: CHAT domain-containing protein [Sphingomonas sp.]|nr:CHAT domain-containing protein [Sphingomonas sp.]
MTAVSCFGLPGSSAAVPLSVRDSFRIGNGGTIFCSAQSLFTDKALKGMFDIGYSLTCRDAALPVGKMYKMRDSADARARISAARDDGFTCAAAKPGRVEGLGPVEFTECKLKDADVSYQFYALRKGKDYYSAEGLAGYDSVIRLALRSLVADQPVSGEISIATTGVGNPSAFARVQAGTMDSNKALAEAYRRNNAGSYAEAAEFFAVVSNAQDATLSRAESLANEALQKSNLGRYAEADSLFARAFDMVGSDELVARRLRNYRAMHELNQGDVKNALKELDKLPARSVNTATASLGSGQINIDASMARRLNADTKLGRQLGIQSGELLPAEKLEILDGQALQLRGTALRLTGNIGGAVTALNSADAKLQAVRNGTVTSVVWMRAQILGDLAAIAEDTKNAAEANRLYRQGVMLIENHYPGSAALLTARARLAGFLAHSGQATEAEAMFREIVHSQPDASNLPPSFAYVLQPYVDLLIRRPDDPAALAEIFAATQLMVRPGLAQSQAVLARELSGGGDEASRLFRQSVTLSRQVERGRVELARLELSAKSGPEEATRMRVLRAALAQSSKEQVATQSALAGFPRYRAVASEVIALPDMQKNLQPNEAYYRMVVIGDSIYAMFITSASVEAKKLDLTAKQLSEQVNALRETISTVENGKRITYAFDVALAHQMYQSLFVPFNAHLRGVTSLIVEPDGAMLRLPSNLLVVDQASVDSYTKRAAAGGDAEFDFRGINWFGRDRDISTSVSPRSFVQLRSTPPSKGTREYLGMGENSPPTQANEVMVPAIGDRDCTLPLSSWAQPISAKELQVASGILSKIDPNGVQVVTGDQFTDTAIAQRTDLNEYRILHFATHGVVTSRAAKCPAQPALLTSFGGKGSDGLLTFREIFDLKLDADVVVLSACDTAGMASAAATQSAGLSTGGDVALDGLVRAFVGAGGRLVVASHWPVPDEFNATQRLITGLFSAPAGEPLARALRQSQRALMDELDTSHPFYWAAFALVGDGERPLIQKTPPQIAAAK